MAARHASLDCSERGLALRDLESPGGTFVNRQRVLPGQARSLQSGDVIQLGGVQLKVVGAKAAPAAPTAPVPKPQPSPQPSPNSGLFSYVIPGGSLAGPGTTSSPRPPSDGSASGGADLGPARGVPDLGRPGRPRAIPSDSGHGRRAARRLAGSLPTTREARPELDVHPTRLLIRVAPGGGLIRKTVQVSNVGHRLLRSSARIEPPGVPWLALPTEFAGKPFVTIEAADLPLDVTIPETLPQPLTAELVIEGNGGSKRVKVILEAKPAPADFLEPGPEPDHRTSTGRPSAS